MVWLIVGAALLLLWWWAGRASELFMVSVRDGKVLVVRGRLPQSLLNDFHAAVRHVRRGSIRALLQAGGAQVYASGDIDEGSEQRLRNIFRLYPVARLRAVESDRSSRSLGQVLGIVWLAWLLERSSGASSSSSDPFR